MNDPGFDEYISTDAEAVEKRGNDEQDQAEEEEQSFLAPR
jgi:hypothetical protein